MLPDKANHFVRRGQKVADLNKDKMAELPKDETFGKLGFLAFL